MSRMSEVFSAQEFVAELVKDFFFCDRAEQDRREKEYQEEVLPILEEYHGKGMVAPKLMAMPEVIAQFQLPSLDKMLSGYEISSEGDRFDPDISGWNNLTGIMIDESGSMMDVEQNESIEEYFNFVERQGSGLISEFIKRNWGKNA